MRRDGFVFDTVSVPAVRRRGVPADIAARLAVKPLENEEIVSVLSKDLKQACVDAPVATSHVSAPTIAFRGDTLLSIEQHITDDDRAQTYLKRYRIDTSRCNWIPVGRKGA